MYGTYYIYLEMNFYFIKKKSYNISSSEYETKTILILTLYNCIVYLARGTKDIAWNQIMMLKELCMFFL